MSDPIHHAMSSARKFGGAAEDYIEIHRWFDRTKGGMCDVRHRAMRHHAEGIEWCIDEFSPWVEIKGPDGEPRFVSVRMVAEQHIREDLGHIPTMADWLRELPIRSWMVSKAMARPDKGKLRARDKPWSYDPFDEQASASREVLEAGEKILGGPDDPGP